MQIHITNMALTDGKEKKKKRSGIVHKGSRRLTHGEEQQRTTKLKGVTVTAKNKKKASKGLSVSLKPQAKALSSAGQIGPKKTTDKKVLKYEKAKAKASKSGKARHYRKANRKYKRLTK